jgi:hypothetical protein
MTASITIIAVVVAYLSNAVEKKLLNGLDRMVIKWSIKAFPWEHKANSIKSDKSLLVSEASPEWKDAVEHFILALSDQQLVTGLAILISGIANQNNLIGYEFTVMTCLAWFSSTTHLATMDALRSYFRDQQAIRNIRVIGIVSVLLLLIYAFAITTNVAAIPELRTIRVECLLSDRTYDSYNSALILFSWILASVLIIVSYISRVADLYPDNCIAKFIIKVMKPERASQTHYETAPSPATAERGSGPLKADPKHFKRVRKVLRILMNGLEAYDTSFLSSLSTITFSFSYGVSQISLYRWQLAPKLASDPDQMDFGQIVPLFLLALPFLSATEAYYGMSYRSVSLNHVLTFLGYRGRRKPEQNTSAVDHTGSELSGSLRPRRTNNSHASHPSRHSQQVRDSQLSDISAQQQAAVPEDGHETTEHSVSMEPPEDIQGMGDGQALSLATQDSHRVGNLQNPQKASRRPLIAAETNTRISKHLRPQSSR